MIALSKFRVSGRHYILFFLTFLITVTGTALAQKTGKPRMDSLLAQLPQAKRDTDRCRIYNELSETSINRDPVLAFGYAGKAMTFAKKTNWKQGMAYAYLNYALIYNDRPQYKQADENFNKAIQLAQQINSYPLLAELYYNKGYGDYLGFSNTSNDIAKIELKKSVLLAIKANLTKTFVKCIKLVSDPYFYKDQYVEALAMYQELLKVAGSNNLYRAYITMRVAVTYINLKKNEDALINYQAAEKLLQNSNNTAARGYLLDSYALYYLGIKDTTKGIGYLEKAAQLFAEDHDGMREASELWAIGNYLGRQHKYNEAISNFQKAAEIYKGLNDDGEGRIYYNIALTYKKEKKPGLTFEYYQKDLSVFKRNENKVSLADYTNDLGYYYRDEHNNLEAIKYFKLCADMYGSMQMYRSQAYMLSDMAISYVKLKDYNNALNSLKSEANVGKELKDERLARDVNNTLIQIYNDTHNYDEAIKHELAGEQLGIEQKNPYVQAYADIQLSTTYAHKNDFVKSLAYAQKVLKLALDAGFYLYEANVLIATAYYKQQQYSQAMKNVQQSLKINVSNINHADAYNTLGLVVRDAPDSILAKQGIVSAQRYDKALEYLNTGYNLNKEDELGLNTFTFDMQTDYWHELSVVYEKQKDFNKAYTAYKNYILYRDSAEVDNDQVNFTKTEAQYNYTRQADSIKYQQQLTGEKLKQQTLLLTQQQQGLLINQQKLNLANNEKDIQQLNFLKTQSDLKANQNRLKASQKEQALSQATMELQKTELGSKRAQSRYFIIGMLILVAMVFFIALNYNNQRKANRVIVLANEQTAIQKAAAESRLAELNAAQAQLVQTEKLASLGELTAGIAHEIQNPLNFVNNFSEVNQEMLHELEDELKAGNIDEALLIAADIIRNEEKIIHHGKRADAIVKNMLQHSRSNGGEKQLTDVNALADEYFRLSYHGLRAKEKSFNAELVTNLDPTLPQIKVIPQDIGRVLLNLFNNAFYAVNQKQKTAGPYYKPTVTLTTFSPTTGGWGVSVKDNGNGIPDAIKDKIMQPFFTTKPTGEGTGLGLSLSYDIVVKGHGGKIDIQSKEGEGSEFIIILPGI